MNYVMFIQLGLAVFTKELNMHLNFKLRVEDIT